MKTYPFWGTKCEIKINECDPNPCINGGKCIDGENKFLCNCGEFYEGVRCQTPILQCNKVGVTFCNGTGVCIGGVGNQPTSCLCDRDWAGLECKEYLRCNSYCKNGGTCYYDAATKAPKCLCTFNFEGETCDKQKKSIF